ncbi:MAG: sortase [Anaerolineae bacterium]
MPNSEAQSSRRLKPLPSWQHRLWKTVSNVFILAGIGLLGLGGWMAYQGQTPAFGPTPPPLPPESLEDNPLPVVELAAPAATPTPTDTPSPSPSPTATATLKPGETPPPTFTPTTTPSPEPTATFTPTPVPPASSPPARIIIPAINLDADVVEVGWHQETHGGQTVSVWDVAEYAAGWHRNSALPGEVGNMVLSGHHNIKGEVFRYLVDLEPGHVITLYADDRPFNYVVDLKFILKDRGEPPEVRQQNARWIGPFSDERLTLVTCWPFNSNTHRLVVVAKPTLTPPDATPPPRPTRTPAAGIRLLEDIFR